VRFASAVVRLLFSPAMLDDGLNPVPPGVPGELFVGGRCVARGYLGDPELTAARFVPAAPLDGGAAGFAYRTGDVACECEDGSFEVLGRRDLQVKLRGFRIELEEVERHLRAAPGVRDATVAAVRDGDGVVDGLVAQVVPHAGEHVDLARVRQALGARLPAHCVPSAIRCVERLPLLPSGKLDRAALAQADLSEREPEPAAAAPPVEPRTDEERALAAIWCEVLDLDRVGVTESFFDLGGHSLLAVQVLIRVEEQLAVEVPLRELYERPTIAELGELLAR
jgi:acyl carrier protein